jgi:hypothetical protein
LVKHRLELALIERQAEIGALRRLLSQIADGVIELDNSLTHYLTKEALRRSRERNSSSDDEYQAH